MPLRHLLPQRNSPPAPHGNRPSRLRTGKADGAMRSAGSGLTRCDCEALALQLRARLLDLAIQRFPREERPQRDSVNVNQHRPGGRNQYDCMSCLLLVRTRQVNVL